MLVLISERLMNFVQHYCNKTNPIKHRLYSLRSCSDERTASYYLRGWSYMLFSLVQLALQNLVYMALHLERNGGVFPKQLSKEDERKCLVEIAEGNHSARNKLIEHNLRLVAYIVNKHYHDSKEQEDLISIGIIGLIRAAETFNIEKNINFSTYASKCIDKSTLSYGRLTRAMGGWVFFCGFTGFPLVTANFEE